MRGVESVINSQQYATLSRYLFIEFSQHANTVVLLRVVMKTHHTVSLVHCCKDLIIFDLRKTEQHTTAIH